jgi:RHS repeat-associated protein
MLIKNLTAEDNRPIILLLKRRQEVRLSNLSSVKDRTLGYTGKPYDAATGMYNYGYRDYKPQAARFTTVDPIRDGNNWYAYVNNDPVNWVDLWGLDGLLVWDATMRNDGWNNQYYNYLVDHDYEAIIKATEEKSIPYKIIKGNDATEQKLRDTMKDMEPDRTVINAHGTDKGKVQDVNGNEFNVAGLTAAPNSIIDNVSCYADQGPKRTTDNNAEIRAYNNKIIGWNQTNYATGDLIPESMRTGVDNSGEPPMGVDISPVPANGGDSVGNNKKNY